MVTKDVFSGGCLCGRLRYSADAPPVDAGYCHCRLCQRSSGAPVLAWASFPTGCFAYTDGSPAIYRSSPHGQREFCANCGTQLVFRDLNRGTSADVNIASLDDPEAFEPEYHIWTQSRIRWFDTADDLPRHSDAGPDG